MDSHSVFGYEGVQKKQVELYVREGGEKKLPSQIQLDLENRHRMAQVEMMQLDQRCWGKALRLRILAELKACSQVGSLSTVHRSNRLVNTILGHDETIDFSDYLNMSEHDERLDEYCNRE